MSIQFGFVPFMFVALFMAKLLFHVEINELDRFGEFQLLCLGCNKKYIGRTKAPAQTTCRKKKKYKNTQTTLSYQNKASLYIFLGGTMSGANNIKLFVGLYL